MPIKPVEDFTTQEKTDFRAAINAETSGAAAAAQAAAVQRTNHTGEQAISTVTGLQTALESKAAKSGPFETWVFEGDSWTAGTAQGNDRETYPVYINELVGDRVEIINVATAGHTAATMASTFAAQVTPNLTATTGKPSWVFLLAGTNDPSAGRTTTQLRDDLRAMWTAARAAGAKVCAFTLPHRTAPVAWSQADWATINAQIIADSSYYDALVRTDIIFSNAGNANDFTDQLHINTAAHKSFAGQVLRAIHGGLPWPNRPSNYARRQVAATTLSANTRRNLAFTGSSYIDYNSEGTTETVGSDSGTDVFTCYVAGTYELKGRVLVGGLSSGDTAYLSAWVTPVSTGTEVEHRLDYKVAAGANMMLAGDSVIAMAVGDKINLSINSSRASSSLLTNDNFSLFAVRLVSIP